MPLNTLLILMGTGIYKAEFLEERHSVRIILMLKANGPMVRTEFYRAVAKGMTTTYDRVENMLRAGIIEEEVMTQRPFAKTIRLSSKGMQIAEKLEEIEGLLGDLKVGELYRNDGTASIAIHAKDV